MVFAGLFSINDAYSQELKLATFQETAQVLVDRTISDTITASVTLQSTSNQEIKIPSDINQKILENPRIVSVILTNQEGCGVLGVIDQGCILINIVRAPEDTNIVLVQEAAKEIGDELIDDLNGLFDTKANYHSSFLHHRDEINVMLETSGAVSGRDVVSAVYTMPKESTQSMYQKTSALILDKQIRDSGGFYNVANALASHDESHMTISIIPSDTNALYQIRTSSTYSDAKNTDQFKPLEYLQVDDIERSKYFSDGFYPLNSIFQIVMLSPERIEIHDMNTNLIPTAEVDGEIIPTELTQNGWVFDNKVGTKIEGKYLFGTRTSASGNELSLAFGEVGETSTIPNEIPEEIPNNNEDIEFDESIAIVAIIVIFAIAAAGFYLKGYRRS